MMPALQSVKLSICNVLSYDAVQGAGKRSDDASTATCQSINRYCPVKRTDEDRPVTRTGGDDSNVSSYDAVQGAGKRSDDASTATCQTINCYSPVKRTDEDRPVKRTGGNDSNVSSCNAIHGAGKRFDDASAASQTIKRYCPVKRMNEDRPVKRTGGNDRNTDLPFYNTAQSIGTYYPDDANALEHFTERGSTSYRYDAFTSLESQTFWNRSIHHLRG